MFVTSVLLDDLEMAPTSGKCSCLILLGRGSVRNVVFGFCSCSSCCCLSNERSRLADEPGASGGRGDSIGVRGSGRLSKALTRSWSGLLKLYVSHVTASSASMTGRGLQ